MDTGRLLNVAPHYLAMLLLAFLVTALAGVVDGVGFWAELALVFVVVFGYRRAVLWLDVAPDAWRREH